MKINLVFPINLKANKQIKMGEYLSSPKKEKNSSEG
jgi:hypothetical protein